MPLTKKTILVVDDEELIREILGDLFRLEGATVLEASCGDDALEILKKEHFDVLLTDARMPGGDGLSLVRQLQEMRTEKLNPKVFLCSGYNDISAQEAVDIGILQVFTKPFDLTLIRNEIAKHLIS